MLSYVHGIGDRPLSGDTVSSLLERTVRRYPERTALVVPHQQIRWSFETLAKRVEALAAALLDLGLAPGDRIGILSPNNAEWVLTQFATARAGLVLVNLNPGYRTAELLHALRKVGCRALIAVRSFRTGDYAKMVRTLRPKLPALEHVVWIGEELDGLISAGLDRGGLDDLQDQLQFDDPINIQFTSGTTGRPKAAPRTHHNMVNNAILCADRMRLTADDRLCLPVPMYHCFGMVLGTLCAFSRGASVVMPAEWFDPRATLAAIHDERATALHGVPTMFIEMLDHPERATFDLGSLRTGIMAGAPCPAELMRRVTKQLHLHQITIAYGMTETGPVSFQTDIDDSFDRRIDSVGRVLPHTEVKIVDSDGRIVPRDTAGELLTRGYCVMPGYWGDEKRNEEAFDGRWMRSGDLATLDADGYCRIVGRVKDMLIRGGENIYPREIEEVLYRHPAVEEAEVFGVPDPKLGEEVCAWIKPRQGAEISDEDVREFCRGRMAHFKVPRYVEIVDAFPTTATGKVQKYKMRESMVDELKAGEPTLAAV